MKKKTIIAYAGIAVFTFFSVQTGFTSPWEGAAAAAPDGELPAKGFYVATNSFPRNTVVDITNIETNKSTRAIVAGGLDSPGLLVVVSREAAELIGLRSGSVGRIRMTQPSDPIAYLRFTEGLSAGISDYDSGDVTTEDNYVPPTPSPATSASATPPANSEPVPPSVSGGYFLEPEWGGTNSRAIVDLPDYVPDPPISPYEVIDLPHEELVELTPEESQEPEEYAWYPVGESEEKPEEVLEEIAEVIPEETPEEFSEVPEEIAWKYDDEDEPAEEIAELISEDVPEEAAEEIAEYIPEDEEEPSEVVIWDNSEEDAQTEELAQAEETEPADEIAQAAAEDEEPPVEYALVPAEERQPAQDIYGIDPSLIIPEITAAEPEPEPEPAPVVATPSPEPVRESIPVFIPDPAFSIPRIRELDRGWYYVQLAAFDNPEAIENAVRYIDRNYNPVVFKDGDHWYRILLGPLNQGESAAILQRFKSIGYKDAFVRLVR